MNLIVQTIALRNVSIVGQLGSRGLFLASNKATDTITAGVGQCFAFGLDELRLLAQGMQISWHHWLLRRATAGLWEESSKDAAYVCYVMRAGMIQLFHSSREDRFPGSFYAAVASGPAYLETGRDSYRFCDARPLALWDPPGPVLALWPRGPDGETDGNRVVDAGQVLGYYSEREIGFDRPLPPVGDNSDFIRVPQVELECFNYKGGVYHYLNRWGDVCPDLSPTN